jgi:hypothetical protein
MLTLIHDKFTTPFRMFSITFLKFTLILNVFPITIDFKKFLHKSVYARNFSTSENMIFIWRTVRKEDFSHKKWIPPQENFKIRY